MVDCLLRAVNAEGFRLPETWNGDPPTAREFSPLQLDNLGDPVERREAVNVLGQFRDLRERANSARKGGGSLLPLLLVRLAHVPIPSNGFLESGR